MTRHMPCLFLSHQQRLQKWLSAALLIAILIPAIAFSQTQTFPTTQDLFNSAQQQLADGKTRTARELLEQALKIDDRHVAARLVLGKIAIEQYDWKKANDHFEKALEVDPENFEGHFYRAVCYREIGKFRPEFLRKMPLVGGLLEFKKAEQHFSWILQRDSLYLDVLSQLATLRRYQENYREALALAHRQIVLKPQDTASQVALFDLYRHFIMRNNEKKTLKMLTDRPEPHARFFTGEKLRREKKYARADSIFEQLLANHPQMPMQPVYLALGKSCASQEKDADAERLYQRAIETIVSNAEADLVFEDLKYLINRSEFREYRALQTPVEKMDFIRAFWARRNPMPAAEQNVRLIEHMRRMVFCEQNYEFVGYRSWANSPDKLNYLRFPPAYHLNEFFNDKGLVYLRHGEPDDRIITVGSGIASGASLPPSNESWKYWQTEINPEMTFHFLYDQFASGNLWRLTPTLSHPALLADRFQWHPRYYRMQNAYSAGERYAIEHEMAQEAIASVDTGFVTDRHSWPDKVEALDMPYSTATFRGKGGKTALEVYWGVPLKPVADELPKTESEAHFEYGVAIHNARWQVLEKQRNHAQIELERDEIGDDQLFVESFSTSLQPANYYLALHARPDQTELIGGHAQIELEVPDYSGVDLMISDIVLAREIEPATGAGKWIKHGLQVAPNPSRQYRHKLPVQIYFEIYNLELNADAESRFSIEYIVEKKGGKKKFLGLLGGGKSSISVKADRQGNTPFSAEFLAIDVEKIGKGEVALTIKVTDKVSGQTAEKSNQFLTY